MWAFLAGVTASRVVETEVPTFPRSLPPESNYCGCDMGTSVTAPRDEVCSAEQTLVGCCPGSQDTSALSVVSLELQENQRTCCLSQQLARWAVISCGL